MHSEDRLGKFTSIVVTNYGTVRSRIVTKVTKFTLGTIEAFMPFVKTIEAAKLLKQTGIVIPWSGVKITVDR